MVPVSAGRTGFTKLVGVVVAGAIFCICVIADCGMMVGVPCGAGTCRAVDMVTVTCDVGGFPAAFLYSWIAYQII